MIDAKPRFALDGDLLFDYATGAHINPHIGRMKLPDGEWDLPKVAQLISEGRSIEQAFISELSVTRIRQLQEATKKLTVGLNAEIAALKQKNESLRAAPDA